MKYGWSAWKGHLKNWEKLLEEAKDSGFDYVELSLDFPLPIKKDVLEAAVKEVYDRGLLLTIHAPWRGIDLASPWDPIREGALKVIEMTANIASNYNARYVVLHVTTPERLESEIRDYIIKKAVESIKRLNEIEREYGIPLLVENVGRLGHPDVFGRFKDETEVRFCWDIAHSITDFSARHKVDIDRVDVDDVISTWTNSVGDRIECVHVHGITKEKRAHNPLTYPITKRVAAKAIALASPNYVTMEIYYNNNKEVGPRFVWREVEELNSWLRVYLKK